MTDWGIAEARFVNRSNRTMCVLNDQKDNINGERFIRSTPLQPGQSASGDAVFPCDNKGRIHMNATGVKATSSGWSGVHLNVHNNSRITVGNTNNPLGVAGAAFHFYKHLEGKTDGVMNYTNFLNRMNGGQPIRVYNQNETLVTNYRGSR